MSNSRTSPDPRYGSWKFVHELEYQDFVKHPIWLWCVQLGLEDEEDGPEGGDETSMRPLLDSDEVPLDHLAPPIVLLKIKGTPHYACGLYEHEKRRLESIDVFLDNGDMVPLKQVDELARSATLVVMARIDGKTGVEFALDPNDGNSAVAIQHKR